FDCWVLQLLGTSTADTSTARYINCSVHQLRGTSTTGTATTGTATNAVAAVPEKTGPRP
ncbi:hypothetical protein HMPREF0004_1748, partial [Achromobacter piechaudii ATCC 43553]